MVNFHEGVHAHSRSLTIQLIERLAPLRAWLSTSSLSTPSLLCAETLLPGPCWVSAEGNVKGSFSKW